MSKSAESDAVMLDLEGPLCGMKRLEMVLVSFSPLLVEEICRCGLVVSTGPYFGSERSNDFEVEHQAEKSKAARTPHLQANRALEWSGNMGTYF